MQAWTTMSQRFTSLKTLQLSGFVPNHQRAGADVFKGLHPEIINDWKTIKTKINNTKRLRQERVDRHISKLVSD